MPVRAPRVCGLCGGVHRSGERCPRAAVQDRERKARFDLKRPGARARGYDAGWQEARAKHLAAHPFCQRCGTRAVLVDHIIPVRQAPHRRLDPTNFQSLCVPCHSRWKQARERK
ncbi:HNH endonuclease [Blastochloris viridis]|uniref:HNH endonuclease n=1 Tax=Blastochloris viridis TaxID=1079 RepID=UPI0009E84DF2|nr:HNH endonuclease signature motif containing protein [Blastochloris viridis]